MVHSLERESHYIEIGPLDLLHTDISNPVLYPVSSGFIKRLIMIYIVIDLLIAEVCEPDQGRGTE